MLEDYQNKVCVVTGAASGIGKALCEKLVALGAQVYALDRNKADIEGLSAFVETDLSDKGSIDAAFGVLPQVIDRFFGVAGLSGARTSYWLTFTVNFIANKYMTDTYLEKRIPSGGSIAYVTSCGGLMWEKWRKEYVKVMDCKTWDEMVAFMKSVSPKDGVGVMAYTLSKQALPQRTFSVGRLVQATALKFRNDEVDEVLIAFGYHRAAEVESVYPRLGHPRLQLVCDLLRVAHDSGVSAA